MFWLAKFGIQRSYISAGLLGLLCFLSGVEAAPLNSEKLPAIDVAITNAISEKKLPGAVF